MAIGAGNRRSLITDSGSPRLWITARYGLRSFTRLMPQTIYVSATPDEYEISRANEAASRQGVGSGIVEQLVRPTGLIDPKVSVRPVESQILDLFAEIQKRV